MTSSPFSHDPNGFASGEGPVATSAEGGAFLPPSPRRRRFLSSKVLVSVLAVSATVAGVSMGLRSANAAGGDPSFVNGVVFRDYNQNGVRDAREPGIAGASVTATCDVDDDNNPATAPKQVNFGPVTTTNEPDTINSASSNNGKYSIPVQQGACRVQFAAPTGATYLFPSHHGADNGTTVQFVTVGATGATGVDASFANPTDYCTPTGTEPQLALTVMCNGDPMQSGAAASYKSMVSFGYSANGTGAAKTTLTTASQTGSVYGVAYSAKRNLVYSAAYLFRHMGVGPAGLDAIYATNPNSGGASVWLDGAINTGSISSNSARGLTTNGGPSYDSEAFPKINTIGYGDIDVDDADQTLYAVNLLDRKIYPIDLDTKAVKAPLTVPDPGCPDGAKARPFAIEFHDGKLYVGTTCTGENFGMANPTSKDNSMLSAHVYAYDPTAGTWGASIIDVPLNYRRGLTMAQQPFSNYFYAWTDVDTRVSTWFNRSWNGGTWAASAAYFSDTNPRPAPGRSMPILSDLEFDWDGSLILSIGDRQGSMLGYNNYGPQQGVTGFVETHTGGDTLRAAPPTVGGTKYRLESNGILANGLSSGAVPDNNTGTGQGGSNSNQGPGGGEFYGQENYLQDLSETGGYASEYIAGYPDMARASGERFTYGEGAVSWYNGSSGNYTHGARIYHMSESPVALNKQNGLGDLEALCGQAPLEIGNRVWFDRDRDGVQDPAEVPISGVVVKLVDGAGSTVATTTTDAAGEYYFDVQPNTAYKIVFDTANANVAGIEGVTSPADLLPTMKDSNAGSDAIDSDMDQATKTITYTTGGAGQNDHTLDAGFTVKSFDLALKKTLNAASVPVPPATWEVGSKPVFDLTVYNQSATVQTFDLNDEVTPNFELFAADNPPAQVADSGDGDKFTVTWTITDGSQTATATVRPVDPAAGELATGEHVTIPLKTRLKSLSGRMVNLAEISNFDDNTNAADGDAASGDLTDVDSTPDGNLGNDNQPANPGDPTDNVIDQNGKAGGDEDDQDIAGIMLYDVALIKTLAQGQKYVIDTSTNPPTATFDITVKNQGEYPVMSVGVSDYVPAGMDTPSWSGAVAADGVVGSQPKITFNGSSTGANGLVAKFTIDRLDAGEQVTFPVKMVVRDMTKDQFINTAEVTSMKDVDGAPVVDIDSTPDNDPTNDEIRQDAGIDPAHNNDLNSHNDIDYDRDNNNNPIDTTSSAVPADERDEDDQDVEVVILPFDLALRKVLNVAKTDFPVAAGKTVTFNIEVINQSRPVKRIAVTDYIDTTKWTAFEPALNPAGNTTGDKVAPYTWDATKTAMPVAKVDVDLAFGQKIIIPVTLRVRSDYKGSIGDLINWAEISNFDNNLDVTDGDAASGALKDVDSTPDQVKTNDNQPAKPGDPTDNEINNKNNDEDDQDLAGIEVLDLALRKTVSTDKTKQPVGPGSVVWFNIEVFNQGTVNASDIKLIDYVNTTMWETFDPALNPAGKTTGDEKLDYTWSAAAPNGTALIKGTLKPGESVIVPVALKVKAGVNGIMLKNRAEITGQTAVDSNGNPMTDVDSTPDTTDKDPLVDDVIDNSGGDEDDHDEAVISSGTFDLALRKQLAKGQSGKLKIGDQVTFTLTIFNQGTIDATGVEITDYIPAGLTLDDADWSVKGDKATLKTKLSLKAGAQTTVDITFKVNDKAASGQIINWAEISEQRGPDGEIIPDVDSTPNANNHSEPGEEDNLKNDDVIDQDGNHGGDEDDHDPAVIEIGVPDLAIDKIGDQSLTTDTLAVWHIEVTNDGNIDVAGPIKVVDSLPAGVEYATGYGDGWTCEPQDLGTVLCTTEAGLKPGEKLPQITIEANITDGTGELMNVANVEPAPGETKLENNVDQAPVTVPSVESITTSIPDEIPSTDVQSDTWYSSPAAFTGAKIGGLLIAGGLMVFLGLILVRRRKRDEDGS